MERLSLLRKGSPCRAFSPTGVDTEGGPCHTAFLWKELWDLIVRTQPHNSRAHGSAEAHSLLASTQQGCQIGVRRAEAALPWVSTEPRRSSSLQLKCLAQPYRGV